MNSIKHKMEPWNTHYNVRRCEHWKRSNCLKIACSLHSSHTLMTVFTVEQMWGGFMQTRWESQVEHIHLWAWLVWTQPEYSSAARSAAIKLHHRLCSKHEENSAAEHNWRWPGHMVFSVHEKSTLCTCSHTYSKAVFSELDVRTCDIAGPARVICQCYKADFKISTHTTRVSEKIPELLHL